MQNKRKTLTNEKNTLNICLFILKNNPKKWKLTFLWFLLKFSIKLSFLIYFLSHQCDLPLEVPSPWSCVTPTHSLLPPLDLKHGEILLWSMGLIRVCSGTWVTEGTGAGWGEDKRSRALRICGIFFIVATHMGNFWLWMSELQGYVSNKKEGDIKLKCNFI